MTTSIFIRVLMMAPYFAVRIFAALTRRDVDGRGATALGLGVLFLFTGIGHFMQTEPMAQMLPPWVPERILLVYVTGVLECAIAVGFLVPKSRQCTGGVVAGMLILFFAPINNISMGDYAWGPIYLLIRAPLQVIIVFWVY